MLSKVPVISVSSISKCFQLYEKPQHRFYQGLFRGRRQLYKEFWALKDISFKVFPGETVGIIGRNGSGKSTLLQIICGTLTPTYGEITATGRIAALLELGAGFNPDFTGRENVYLNASILGLSKPIIDERFSTIADFAEIGDFIEQPVRSYSSGMFVRLAFAVAIHSDPVVLIVDEALAVGDARFQAKCMNRIKQLKQEGTTIIFVSHDVSAVRALCERAIWLHNGKMKMAGEVFPVTAEYTKFIFEDNEDESLLDTELLEDSSPPAISTAASSEPINHWGSHVGIIKSSDILDSDGNHRDLFTNRESIQIRIEFQLPENIDRENLSVAFSIKNLQGSDLIISATWDQNENAFNEIENIATATFTFDNCLNSGNYVLVAAIEDRSGATIEYYEYIEGANYFSTAFSDNVLGQFMPVVTQDVTGPVLN